jgi:hypothetical protein
VERKLSPVGFNAFAIIGLLVILPFSTAVLTNLASAPENKPFEDIVGDGTNYISGGNPNGIHGGTLHSNWIDIGGNFSSQYKELYPSLTDSDLECFSLIENNAFYSSNPEWDIDVTQCEGWGSMISPYLYSLGYTNYNFDGRNYLTMGKTHDFIPGGGYIGISGDNFAFSVEQPIFDNLDHTKDLGGFQIKMLDDSTIYDCDNFPKYNITFDYSITFVMKNQVFETTHYQTLEYNNWNSLTIDGFSFEGDNAYIDKSGVVDFDYSNFPGLPPGVFDSDGECVLGVDLNFNFDGLQSIDIADWIKLNGGNKSNMSAIIEITDLRSPDMQFGDIGYIPLPFTGNGEYKVSYGAKYTSATQTNFFLKGGALIIGILLFVLAIASTPYYDPFMNLFKGRV